MLIDYENVQPKDIEAFNKEHYKVIVFHGSNQTKVNIELARALQKMHDRADYIEIDGNGKNSLDFHIAFYIGQLAVQDPESFFHIISKDTGFDPLIRHLKSKKILACRSSAISEMPQEKVLKAKTKSEKLAVIIDNLQGREASKPSTYSKLLIDTYSIFKKRLPEEEIKTLVGNLIKQKLIIVSDDEKVTYNLSTHNIEAINKPVAVKSIVAVKQAATKATQPKVIDKIDTVSPNHLEPKDEKIVGIVDALKKRGTATPKTTQALYNAIKHVYGRELSSLELLDIFNELKNQKIVIVNDKMKVSYNLA